MRSRSKDFGTTALWTYTGPFPPDARSGTAGNDILSGTARDDRLNGLFGDDTLFGLGGQDTLIGGLGLDRMIGGKGDDLYTTDTIGDVMIERADGGDDTIRSSVNLTLGAHVETLILTGTYGRSGNGNNLANTIRSSLGSDTLLGLGGNDSLLGMRGVDFLSGGNGYDLLVGGAHSDDLDGGRGLDTLVGGRGDDEYFINRIDDVILEIARSGRDRVYSSASFTLSDHVETLYLLGSKGLSGTGNTGKNRIEGTAASDTLSGLGGKDSLYGAEGDDLLSGGAGDDHLEGGNGADSLLGGAGNDDLAAYFQSGAKLMKGGSGDDILTSAGTWYPFQGNFDDTLNGGTGADTMSGGPGNDVYYIDSLGDVVHEPDERMTGNFGIDTVIVSLSSYSLGTFLPYPSDGLDNLRHSTATDFLGTGNGRANDMSGNAGKDTLIGYYGNDTLHGRDGADKLFGHGDSDRLFGGRGNDTLDGGVNADMMRGGAGNDIYLVDSVLDRVGENADAGTDTVRTTLGSYTLGENLEALVRSGHGAFTAIGNDLANRILGLNGDDTLDGKSGNDTLIGGGGRDSFVFSTDLGGGNADLVSDFSTADTFRLDSATAFAGLTAGRLAASAFRIIDSDPIPDATDRILYDQATGKIYYDPDGSGIAAPILFALVQPGTVLSAADFTIF